MTNPFAYPDAPAAAPTTPATTAAAAPSSAPTPADADPFAGPAARAPRGPRIRDMHGRLLLLTPHLVETVANRLDKENPGATQQRMTTDVVILDGGPCPYGGAPEKINGKPHDKVAQIPHRNARMFISAVGIISQSREALDKRKRGEPGMVLGRLSAGVAKQSDYSPPYLLTPPTDADKALARAYLATVDPFA